MTQFSTPSVIEDDLKRQHQFVEEQKRHPEAFSLVVPAAFVQSIRDLGYKSTYTALDELIDNAIQASATNVEVFLAYQPDNKSQKKPDYIVIVDDGHGMEPDMIRLAVKWGGTHRHDDRNGFGRYGFGLPSACVSIGRAYTVYSKIPGKSWHGVTVDIDEVAKAASSGKGYETKDRRLSPPKFVQDHVDISHFESGTVIVIETLDRLGSGFKTTTSFVRNMLEHVGVIYRKMIPTIDLKINGKKVTAVDPLFLDPKARWFDDWPITAQAEEGIEFEVETPRGEKGRVRLRAAWFPFNFHLQDPDGFLVTTNHNDRYKIMKEFNGILVCRAGRQIDCITKLEGMKGIKSDPEQEGHEGSMTFVNFDRFWKVEVDFDPVLDEYFGITTHKQQAILSESIKSRLGDAGLGKLIRDLRKKMRRSRADVKAKLEVKKAAIRASEQAMADAQDRKPRSASTSPRQAQKAEENLNREAKRRAELTGEPFEQAREQLAVQTSKQFYKVSFEALPDGPVFRGERMGRQYRLMVNTLHRFYSDLYEPAGQVPGLQSKLEAALFVAAEAELDSEGTQETFFTSIRVFLSQRLSDVLAGVDGSGDREDEASATLEDEEVEGSDGE